MNMDMPGEQFGSEGKLYNNPLISGIVKISNDIAHLKDRVKAFYFEVLFSIHKCPACGGTLHMTQQNRCLCSCGKAFDPTIAFQTSTCCQASIVRKTYHYACSNCSKSIPSRFLFDEKLFDKAYFRQMMQESRERAKRKREEMRRFALESQSDTWSLLDEPDLDSIPDLTQDLNEFIQMGSGEVLSQAFEPASEFDLNIYREHIFSALNWNTTLFSEIPILNENNHRDRIYRFISLVFMQHDREVELTQNGDDLWVRKLYHETNNEG